MAKKRLKKKHYYHKGPFYMYTDKELNNPAAILLEVRKKSDDKKLKDWYKFVDLYGYQAKPLAVPEEEDIIVIGGCMLDSNTTLSTYYYEHIYALFGNDYNPYYDKIPVDKLPENLSNIIKKKQKYIKNMYYYRKEYQDLDLLVQYNRKDIQNLITLDLRNYKRVIRLFGDNTYIYIRKAENIELVVQRLNELERVQELNELEAELNEQTYDASNNTSNNTSNDTSNNNFNDRNKIVSPVWVISDGDARKICNIKKSKIDFKNYHTLFCIFSYLDDSLDLGNSSGLDKSKEK